MDIIIRNQSFLVRGVSDLETAHIKTFSGYYHNKQITTVKYGSSFKKKVIDKGKYFIFDVKSQGFIFPINILREFLDHLIINQYSRKDIKIKGEESTFDGDNISLKFHSTLIPRDEQDMFINGILNRRKKQVLVEAVTGYGKTFMVAKALAKFNKRTLFYINAQYISKWVKDLHTYFDIPDEKIYVIQGADSLNAFINNDPKQYDFVIASNSTMIRYIDEWYLGVEGKYSISPEEFLKEAGIKVMVSDESHLFFANLYKATLAFNPVYLIGLSATLITKDRFISMVHYALFDEETRLGLKVYRKYAIVYLSSYHVVNNNLKMVSGGYGYSHKTYEVSIINRPSMLANYIELINAKLKLHFIDRRKDGEKAIIFASSLQMISIIYEYINELYPNLDVRIFKGKSDMKDALEPDIIISHNQSLGAAIDIKGLITIVSSINMDSPAGNLQMLGRLREIPNYEVRYIQLYADNIDKHKKYLHTFKKYLSPRVKEYRTERYDKDI